MYYFCCFYTIRRLRFFILFQTQGINEARKLLMQASDLLKTVSRTVDLGIVSAKMEVGHGSSLFSVNSMSVALVMVHEYSIEFVCVEDDYPMMGFDPLVNQRLLPPTFPRYSKIKDRVESLEYVNKLIDNLLVVCRVNEITDLHAILVSLAHIVGMIFG